MAEITGFNWGITAVLNCTGKAGETDAPVPAREYIGQRQVVMDDARVMHSLEGDGQGYGKRQLLRLSFEPLDVGAARLSNNTLLNQDGFPPVDKTVCAWWHMYGVNSRTYPVLPAGCLMAGELLENERLTIFFSPVHPPPRPVGNRLDNFVTGYFHVFLTFAGIIDLHRSASSRR